MKVNNRKVLDGVLEASGSDGDDENASRGSDRAARHRQARPAWRRRRRLLLGAGRKDESGDFTKGAELEAGAIADDAAFSFTLRRRKPRLGQTLAAAAVRSAECANLLKAS
jgi:histidyl-tRNA synthetase